MIIYDRNTAGITSRPAPLFALTSPMAKAAPRKSWWPKTRGPAPKAATGGNVWRDFKKSMAMKQEPELEVPTIYT